MAKTGRWLSLEEIAKHLSISKETVYRWLERGRIPAHKVGKQWRFQIVEVDEWVRKGGAVPHSAEEKQGDGCHG